MTLGGIHAVKHNRNPCQPPYPIMYQSFAIEAQADATRCCIIVMKRLPVAKGVNLIIVIVEIGIIIS